MLSRHRVSRAAIELIEQFEGYRRKAAQLPDGRWTIGYGHTLTAREGAEVNETDAEALLVYDLIAVSHAVNEYVLAPIGQNQFDALCCFTFNIGVDNFRRSQVLKRLNAGSAVQAACAMELWRKADFEGERIVVDALVRRRAAEKALFLTPENGAWVAAPSPLLRPVIDLDALDLVPMRRPVEVETSMVGERVTARRDDLDTPEADFEAAPAPVTAIATAAEAVTDRLAALFADPGVDADALPPPEDDASEPVAADEAVSLDEPEAPGNAFEAPAETVEASRPELEPEPETPAPSPMLDAPVLEPVPVAGPSPVAATLPDDAELEIPQAPPVRSFADDLDRPIPGEIAASQFIPARTRPTPAQQEGSVVWDLGLALFGLAFIGFAVAWGTSARTDSIAGIPVAVGVGLPAGVAGVLFFAVAVFRLLRRLGQQIEQD